MTITGFSELTLEARDPSALARFYQECFGLTELSRERGRVWLGVGDTARLGLWRPGRKEFGDEGGAHVHFALTAQPGSLEGIAARLRAAGAEVTGPLEHDGGDRSVYARDPEGNVVEAWDLLQRVASVDALRQRVA
jgi:catechol-2,3-dioxygenase